jgi:hypothetical protein
MGTYDISARPDAVISGRFGGGPYPDVSLYDIAASTISFYFADGNDADPGHVDFGPITEVGGVASDWTIAAAGRFTDYGFSDLLLYDSQAQQGNLYHCMPPKPWLTRPIEVCLHLPCLPKGREHCPMAARYKTGSGVPTWPPPVRGSRTW